MPWLAIDVVSFITFFGISFTCDGFYAILGIDGIPVYIPNVDGNNVPMLSKKSFKKLMINIYNIY